MADPRPEMVRRQQATQTTLDRYRPKVFDWRTGITCVHLARFHLKAMGHHVPTVPRIRSALAAKRALQSNGWESVEDMLDSMLPRIAPSMMLLGDLAVVPGEDGFASIMVCAGPQTLIGWVNGSDTMANVAVHNLAGLKGAWRV